MCDGDAGAICDWNVGIHTELSIVRTFLELQKLAENRALYIVADVGIFRLLNFKDDAQLCFGTLEMISEFLSGYHG